MMVSEKGLLPLNWFRYCRGPWGWHHAARGDWQTDQSFHLPRYKTCRAGIHVWIILILLLATGLYASILPTNSSLPSRILAISSHKIHNAGITFNGICRLIPELLMSNIVCIITTAFRAGFFNASIDFVFDRVRSSLYQFKDHTIRDS